MNPIKNFKEVFRTKHRPMDVLPGDKILYTYKDGVNPEIVLAVDTIEKAMVINEVVVFRGEFEGREALGGLLLQQEEKNGKMA